MERSPSAEMTITSIYDDKCHFGTLPGTKVWSAFSVNGQMVNILGCLGHTAFLAASGLW